MDKNIILEVMYMMCGLISVFTGYYALIDIHNQARFGTFLFWTIFGVIMIGGTYIPSYIVGLFVILIGFLTFFNMVKPTVLSDSSEYFKNLHSNQLSYKIWIPALSVGILSMILSFFPEIGGLESLGFSALLSYILCVIVTKSSPMQGYFYEAPRLLHNIGISIILPQILGTLGSIFSEVGVGESISRLMISIVPIGDKLTGVILYSVSMFLFTAIMGNAFAAFSIITAGIGIPFVIDLGGNPAVVGSLGLTSGYCGTLITPMAANFNMIPISILDIRDKYDIIKVQFPISIILLIIHIVLMYLLAF